VLPVFYDTGNLDSYRHACKQFPSQHVVLDKPNESLCFLQDSVIKFVHSTETNARRLLRVESLESIVPKMLGCRPNFLKMEFIKGTVLAECEEWGIVQRLLTWAESSLWTVEKQDPAFYDTCIAFYRDKTRQRIAEYLKRSAKESNTVNGVSVGSIESLLARVPFNELAAKATLHRYHGDFILDNIMQREDGSFVLLDWRESFGDQIQWGDRAYDLAKLRHNIVFNHTNIQKGLFSIYGGPDSSVYVDLKCNYFLMRQLEDVDAFIESRGWNVGNIRILQALIWLNMAPLYEAPLSDFLFYFGKFNLWLALR
jgi:thiamine kinase-like enzyme